MRSKFLILFSMILFSASLLIAACIQPIQPGSSSAALRDLACENIIDVNLDHAYDNYEEEVFWTVHFNFLAFGAEQEPLGCFRLYARNDSAETFAPIDNGGHLIEGCQTVGSMRFMTRTITHSSHNVRQQPMVSGVAHFGGESHIECEFSIQELTEMSVDQAISQIPNIDDIPDLLAHVGTITHTITNTVAISSEIGLLQTDDHHDLDTLTMIAAGNVTPTGTISDTNPLLFYLPLENDPCCTPISMALPAIDTTQGRLRAYMQNDLYRGDNVCRYSPGDDFFWWTDFFVSPDAVGSTMTSTMPTFATREFGITNTIKHCDTVNSLTTRIDWTELAETYDDSHFDGQSEHSSISVWTGPAKLYIGCHPKKLPLQGELTECTSNFNGSLYNVTIDPPDSKPQIDD